MLLVKAKLNTLKVFIFKGLIDSYINHDQIASVNNAQKDER